MLKPLVSFILILCTTLIQPNSANIVQQTCSKTPYPALCLQYLNADPKSSTSNVNGLALIMINVIKNKANVAINKINQLSKSIPTKQKEALQFCSINYTSILVDVFQATQALQKGNPKFAVYNVNSVASEANGCENGFSGKSPLTVENNVMHDASAITSAICKLLF